MGVWDITLILAVAVQATVIAYVHDPRWKGVLYVLPVPFSLAVLALGKPIGTDHALGLPMVLLFAHAVRWLHVNGRLPIVPAIVLAALGYCLIAGTVVRLVPPGEAPFWIALAAAGILGALLHRYLPHREERGHRSPLPLPLKFVLVAGVICAVLAMKHWLQGFMAFFPMVGVVAAYEARHSLWTWARPIPAWMITMIPMLVACRLAQPHLGLGGALALGWALFLPGFALLCRYRGRAEAEAEG